jgi:hypothetical protein
MRSDWLVPTIVALTAGTFLPRAAHADTKVALDLDYVNGIDEGGIDPGTGGALRLGKELDLAIISLTPEIGGSYHSFGGRLDAKHYSGFIGGRLAFGKVIEPAIFAHIGVGRLTGDFPGDTGAAFDAGVALDFTLLPILDLGLHAAYDSLALDGGENFDWFRLGAHAAIGF